MYWQPARISPIFLLMPSFTFYPLRALQQHHPVRLRRRERCNAD
jgi:hypothetical protein